MDKIAGLYEFVKSDEYRKALHLPKNVEETYTLLAQGEYNINYQFQHPVSKELLLLRVNCGSQMNLEHQIEYEYHALKLLESSGRTPKALYVDGSKKLLPHGIMIMEFLPGHAMDYKSEISYAASCLADIHSVKLDETSGLLHEKNPLEAILKECEKMVAVYMASPLGKEKTKRKMRQMLDKGWDRIKDSSMQKTYQCCINTELNSTNFLINGKNSKNYIIDWEKPLYGDPAQDLGHFLAPTTTFWKTDTILKQKEMDQFLEQYIREVNRRFDTEGLKERVHTYIPITCLRGITWCAMAWIEYQDPNKLIRNESTLKKLNSYLNDEFLDMQEKLLDHRFC